MKVRVALFVATAVVAVFTSVAETGSCIDPTTAYRTNSVPCSIMGSGLGTVLLGRNPQAKEMTVLFDSRFRTSTPSAPAAYSPTWVPSFRLFLR